MTRLHCLRRFTLGMSLAALLSGAGPGTWAREAASAGEGPPEILACGTLPGDCDAGGSVAIPELQKAVNMNLGVLGPACNVDGDGSGTVSTDEVQGVVNALLGLDTNAGSITVSVFPLGAALAKGETQSFAGSVLGCGNQSAVTWSIQEGAAGGTIDADGLYTAPQSAGSFHVVATSVADSSKTATATVTVLATAVILDQAVNPSSSDQTIQVSGKIAVTIPGNFLSVSGELKIQEITGIPPPADYSVTTPWFQVTFDGLPPPPGFMVTLRNAVALREGLGEDIQATGLQYQPPGTYGLPSTIQGTDMTLQGYSAPGAIVASGTRLTAITAETYTKGLFVIKYGTSGVDAVPTDSEYAAENHSDPNVPDFIEDVGAFLDRAYNYYVNTLHLREPPKPGSSSTYLVLVGNYATSEWGKYSGYIYVANKFNSKALLGINWQGEDRTLLQWELAHELFHADQNAYRTVFGMGFVQWLTESLADFAAFTVTPNSQPLLDISLVNYGNWYQYQYWDSGGGELIKYLGSGFFAYAASKGGFALTPTFMENDYTACNAGAPAADAIFRSHPYLKLLFSDWVQYFYFSNASPLAQTYYPQVKRVAKSAFKFRAGECGFPRDSNRFTYEGAPAAEHVFTLGDAGGILTPAGMLFLTADYVAVSANSDTGLPKNSEVTVYSVSMMTDVASDESATLFLGKGGRIIWPGQPMPPKGVGIAVSLGKTQSADAFFVLVVNATSYVVVRQHQVRVVPLAITSLIPSSGPVDTAVVLKGIGFGLTQGTSTVKINGVNLTVQSWSDQEIHVTIPEDAPPGDVVVTVNGADSNAVRFTVTLGVTLSGTVDVVVYCDRCRNGPPPPASCCASPPWCPPEPQNTTFTANVTTSYRPQLTYAWTYTGTGAGTGNPLVVPTTDCPYQFVDSCSACGIEGYTVFVTVTDGLGRKGVADVNWGGAY